MGSTRKLVLPTIPTNRSALPQKSRGAESYSSTSNASRSAAGTEIWCDVVKILNGNALAE